MDLIPDIQIPTQNKLIPDPILTPAKSGINTALIVTHLFSPGEVEEVSRPDVEPHGVDEGLPLPHQLGHEAVRGGVLRLHQRVHHRKPVEGMTRLDFTLQVGGRVAI